MDTSKHTRFVILLNKADNRETTKESIQRHIGHLKKLDRDGQLVLCGPFTDYAAGMVVIKAASKDEAEKIAKMDPFVAEGLRTYELRTWLLACEENNYLG